MTNNSATPPADSLSGPLLTSAIVSAGGSIGASDDVALAVKAVLGGELIPAPPVHELNETEFSALVGQLRGVRDEQAVQYLKAAAKHGKLSDRILAILKKASIQVNKSGLNDPLTLEAMKESLQPMIARGAPLSFSLLLGGGKVANALKTGGHYLPDLSEWHSLMMFDAIATAVGEVYAPGATFIPVPDALLHTADLGIPVQTALRHLDTLHADLRMLGIEKRVMVPNVLDHLPEDWTETVNANAREALAREARDEVFTTDLLGQTESLQYSLNTDVTGLSYEQLVLVYAAMAGHVKGIPSESRRVAAELFSRADRIVPHYVGVNWAIRQGDLVGRVVRDLTGQRGHLRLSVHAKPGEPRPALFTSNRLVPSASLLPMHGLGVAATMNKEFKVGITFDLGARLRGWGATWNRGRFIHYLPHSDGIIE